MRSVDLQGPLNHDAENPRHRHIVPFQPRAHGSKIPLPSPSCQPVEKQRGQARLQAHEDGEQSPHSAIALSEGMDQDQFHMDHREGRGEGLRGRGAAGCEPSEGTTLKLSHQSGDLRRSRKWEIVFHEVHLTIAACPRIDAPQPSVMDVANIGSREAVVSVVEGGQFLQGSNLFTTLRPVHFAPALDAEQILQHTPARARLKEVLLQS